MSKERSSKSDIVKTKIPVSIEFPPIAEMYGANPPTKKQFPAFVVRSCIAFVKLQPDVAEVPPIEAPKVIRNVAGAEIEPPEPGVPYH